MKGDPDFVRSRANAALKRVRAAFAGREPRELVLEGERLVRDALSAGQRIDLLLVSEDRVEAGRDIESQHAALVGELRVVRADLLDQVSALRASPGILGLGPEPASRSLAEVDLASGAVLVVAGMADPGNLGALARSAEAAGASALVVVAGGVRPWNEKALRGSMGSLLRLPVVLAASADEAARSLAEHGARQVIASTRGGEPFDRFDWSPPIALWVSGETGTEPETKGSFESVTIPMRGEVESLNVTVAASLCLFAASRARAERDGTQ